MSRTSILISLLLMSCGGGGSTDDASVGMDAATTDSGGGGSCAGEADGASCGTGMICVSEACVEARCGDGFVDTAAGEACDDGNETAFDGCEPTTCAFTCDDDAQCDDNMACNGAETCHPDQHLCTVGAPVGEGAPCDLTGSGDGVCRGVDCVDPGCGNGVVDGTEECDDGNDVGDDGCEADCTFSCETDMDCIDSDVCNGSETCDTTTHACVAGTAMACDDSDDCTMNLCDPSLGCQHPLIDEDMDGHAPDTLGACGDDCDDTRDDIFTGAEELCDGVDNNCNSDVDEIAPTWYIDCDSDGFAGSTDGSRTGCTMPDPAGTGCGGQWVPSRPVDMSNTDCHDGNADVFPGQTAYFSSTYTMPSGGTSWDYNCDGSNSRSSGRCISSTTTCDRTGSGGTCDGTNGYLTDDCTIVCSGGRFCLLTAPDCGETGTFSSCVSGFCVPRPCTAPCLRLTTERRQTCH